MSSKTVQHPHTPFTKATPSTPTPTRATSPAQLLQRAQAGPEQLTAQEVLQLQRTFGNRAVAQFLTPQSPSSSAAPIQRTIDTAAQALYENKYVKAVTLAHITPDFQLAHTVTPANLAAIQAAVRQLRVNNAAKTLRAKGWKDVTSKTFKAAVARDFNLVAGDHGDVKTAFDLVVAAEETEGQRAARVFVEETLGRESSGVTVTLHGVVVHLDNDQLKHQKTKHPIGTRTVGGGQKFKIDGATPECGSQAWHLATTLPHMAAWARDLGVMVEGQRENHGQAGVVGNVHYEGFCIFARGTKYVLFHCYPEVGSKYDGGKKAT